MSPRPDRDTTLMRVAFTFSERSTCDRNPVGAVIAMNGRALATGYNGAPAGMRHCDHTNDPLLPFVRGGFLPTLEMRGSLTLLSLLTRDPGCKVAVHAEANAIVMAARYGVPVMATNLYTTLEPCRACASLIVNAGIATVYYARPYRNHDGIDLLNNAGIFVEQLKNDR